MTSPRTLLTAWDIAAKKQLGQNFLRDPSTAEMIVCRAKIGPGDVVLEIGAGLGALTIPAAKKCEKVYAVETDRRIIGLLQTEVLARARSNVEIVETDILKLSLDRLWGREDRKLVVLGNLPYHISSQILIWLIRSRCYISRAILMFQKELARRIAAAPGGKDYGRISVIIQYCADIGKVTDVSATHFFPKPKVDSEVVEIRFHHPPKYVPADEAFFFSLVKAAFSKRRKTLKNALAGSELHLDPQSVLAMLGRAAIDPVRRAETLSVQEFVHLSNVMMAERG